MKNSTQPKIETLRALPYDGPQPQGQAPLPAGLSIIIKLFKILAKVSPYLGAKLSWLLFTSPLSRAKHKLRDELLDSAETFDIPFEGKKLKGYAWGKKSGHVILLVHGWESRGTALRAFATPLVAKGYRVVTFDGPAHGDSPGWRISPMSYGRAIKVAAEQFDRVEGIIAHSFGCTATSFMLARNPDIQLKRLVLISSGSNIKFALDEYAKVVDLPDRVRLRFYRMIEEHYNHRLEELDVSLMGDQIQADQRLLVHDLEDEILPQDRSLQILKRWPNTQMVSTVGFGHFRIIKAEEVVERVGRFFE